MEVDKQILNDIEEYRTLQSIVNNAGCDNSREDLIGVLGQRLFNRFISLDGSTRPERYYVRI